MERCEERTFVLGVNYWPRTKAMQWWSRFEEEEVERDFKDLREMGINLVRIFLLWSNFQPSGPSTVDETCLSHLETVLNIAQRHGLWLDITFFTGHMSGPNWAPRWMILEDEPLRSDCNGVRRLVVGTEAEVKRCGHRNIYTDPMCLEAEEVLLRAVVSRFGDHPAVGMWNLGNEPDLFGRPTSADSGASWVRSMRQIIVSCYEEKESLRMPSHEGRQITRPPITCGLHADSLIMDNGLRVDKVFSELDVRVMHGYPMYASGWSRHPLDPDFVPFLCDLTAALSSTTSSSSSFQYPSFLDHRLTGPLAQRSSQTLMEEFGGCTLPPTPLSDPKLESVDGSYWKWNCCGDERRQFMASEDEMADYLELVLRKLHSSGALGAVLWCFADYHNDLWDQPPCDESLHERFFGLVRPDGSWKPHAFVLQRFSQSLSSLPSPSLSAARISVDPDEYYLNPRQNAIEIYQRYLSDRE